MPLQSFPAGSVIKNHLPIQEIQVPALGQEEPQEKKTATHFSILAWEIPWTEEPRGLQSMGSQKVRHNSDSTTTICHSTVFFRCF